MKQIFYLIIFSFVPTILFSQTGLYHVEEEKIVDPDGNVFIAHGANYQGPMFSWPDNPSVESTAADMHDVWEFNTVRINWREFDCPNGCLNPCGAGVEWTQQRNAPIEDYVKAFSVDRDMVSVIDNHDYTVRNKVGDCINDYMVDFWTGVAQAFGTQSTRTGKYNDGEAAVTLTDEQASRIWFDLRNEPLGSGTDLFQQLADDYEEMIQAIRATGAQNIIVLEGSYWGRDYAWASWIKEYGPYFKEKYKNIVFSHHSYGWTDKSELVEYYQWMNQRDLPMLVGECSKEEGGMGVTHANYGDENEDWATGGFEYNGASYDEGIGIIYWAWWGGDGADLTTSGGGYFADLNNEGVPTNLTEEGRIVWADVRRGNPYYAPPCGGDGCDGSEPEPLVDTSNLAYMQPVTVSSTQNDSYLPEYVNDNSILSRWSSEWSDPQWVYVDLGAVYDLDSMVLYWEDAYSSAYEIQVSYDAENWATITNRSGAGGNEFFTISGVGQYVRLYSMERGTEFGISLYDLRLYGTMETDDEDRDGIPDSEDNCVSEANRDQSDMDGDGLGDSCDSDIDGDGLANAEDCDPMDASSGEKKTWYADTDGDGYGEGSATIENCTQPDGYVENQQDQCPDDANKVVPGDCGCEATEESCLDCAGVPNGPAEEDECGVCDGNNECVDCNGDAFGSAIEDRCGNCVEGNTGEERCEQDCNGDFGGMAVIDSCGNCTGGETGMDPVVTPEACEPTAINGTDQTAGMMAYPNPFTEQLTIEVPENGTVTIVDTRGEILNTVKVNQGVNVITTGLNAGLYQLVYRNDSGQGVIKVMKR